MVWLLEEGLHEDLEFMLKRRVWGKGGKQVGLDRFVDSSIGCVSKRRDLSQFLVFLELPNQL